jgi:thermitase
VIYAEPNFSRPLFRPVTTEGAEPALGVANNFDEQWGLHNIGQGFGATTDPIFGTLIHPTYFGTPGADINAPEGWGSDRFGSPLVRIAVLDSGVACDHVDLAGKCWDEQNFVAEHGSTLEDVLGHGTHVAGIAAAHTDNGMGIAGVGRSTGIGAMKVCWEDMSLAILGIVIGQCDDADVVEAIEYVINSGEYQVINMSLAGPEFSITLQNAIDDAWAAGIVVVAGAGNEYTDTLMYPAAYANAIAVGATDQHDNLAAYSTFGDWVSVLAPGSTILSTIPGGFCGQAEGVPSDCYDWKSGTSMATPHVAGLAALLWAHLPAPTNQEVRSIIETSADSSGALAQNFSAWVQHGRINMAAALMDGGSPPPPPPPPPAATTHHVASISVSTVSAGKGRKHARAQIQVLDDLGDPVAGATVSGSFTGSFGESGSAVTNGSGIAVITTGSTAKGGVAFTFCVDNVTASGTSYDEESNATICQTF